MFFIQSVQIELYDADLYSKGIHALVECSMILLLDKSWR